MSPPDKLVPSAGSVFWREQGALFLEGVRLSQLLEAGLPTPFFVYSGEQLRADFAAYADAVAGLDAVVGYAIKANHNPVLLRRLASWGAGAIAVSANELRLAGETGFPAAKTLLHGNGKRREDLDAALGAGVQVSIDSEFDLENLAQRVAAGATAGGRRARVLLRVNPDIDAQVHPYISTGLLDSKFGMPEAAVERLRPRLRELAKAGHIEVRGVHFHLGSTLKTAQPVLDAARSMQGLMMQLRADGHPADTLDVGGGLGIDYSRGRERIATPAELVTGLRPLLAELGLRLWLEPGRNLVGRAGALIGRVLGTKDNGRKRFLITDASMAQLIRPCLYGAYHHIELLNENEGAPADGVEYDVVGPICESSDFLGQRRRLGPARPGDGIIVYDAGAYGFAMASRYNLHLFCAEYLVDGTEVRRVRRAETFDDLARTFADEAVSLP